MPVEIKELLIEINVSDQVDLIQENSDNKHNSQKEILNLCIEEIAKMLNVKNER